MTITNRISTLTGLNNTSRFYLGIPKSINRKVSYGKRKQLGKNIDRQT